MTPSVSSEQTHIPNRVYAKQQGTHLQCDQNTHDKPPVILHLVVLHSNCDVFEGPREYDLLNPAK